MIASFIINAHNVSTGTKAGTAFGSGGELLYALVGYLQEILGQSACGREDLNSFFFFYM